jgi:phage portal protein BeeE
VHVLDWLKRRNPTAPAAPELKQFVSWRGLAPAQWSPRDMQAFAREGYGANPIVYRCVRLIAEAAASAPLRVTPAGHPLAALLHDPNPEQTGVELV